MCHINEKMASEIQGLESSVFNPEPLNPELMNTYPPLSFSSREQLQYLIRDSISFRLCFVKYFL